MCDVESRAKSQLNPVDYIMLIRLAYQEEPGLLPEHLKEQLGEVWELCNLGVSGAYRSLYFRVKNSQMREALHDRELSDGSFD
jgi:hypothetical protein